MVQNLEADITHSIMRWITEGSFATHSWATVAMHHYSYREGQWREVLWPFLLLFVEWKLSAHGAFQPQHSYPIRYFNRHVVAYSFTESIALFLNKRALAGNKWTLYTPPYCRETSCFWEGPWRLETLAYLRTRVTLCLLHGPMGCHRS